MFFERYIGAVDLKESRLYGLNFTSLRIFFTTRRTLYPYEVVLDNIAVAGRRVTDLDIATSAQL